MEQSPRSNRTERESERDGREKSGEEPRAGKEKPAKELTERMRDHPELNLHYIVFRDCATHLDNCTERVERYEE